MHRLRHERPANHAAAWSPLVGVEARSAVPPMRSDAQRCAAAPGALARRAAQPVSPGAPAESRGRRATAKLSRGAHHAVTTAEKAIRGSSRLWMEKSDPNRYPA